jgi:uncharacterized protein (TIGR03000 family)
MHQGTDMGRFFVRRTGPRTLLTGVVLLLGAAAARAQPDGWRSPIRVGPPRSPEQYLQDLRDYETRNLQPDAGPYPPWSWSWPTWRQALEQYGWFGRRACRGGPPDDAGAGVLAGPGVPPVPPAPPGDAAVPAEAAAVIRVRVPPSARVGIDGRWTASTGSERLFVTPPLEAGRRYVWELRARWEYEGKAVERIRRVEVYRGDRRTVDFLLPETLPAP